MTKWLLLLTLFMLSACSNQLPEGVEPVNGFEISRYLGTWHEIARLDHRFERGLTRVTANYSLRDDGGLKVINRGFDQATGEWREAEGRAFFVSDRQTGHLKVSFFGPFYGAYGIIELDKTDYQYALISGPDRAYLWLLAKTPTLANDIKRNLVAKAKNLGYPVDRLIWLDNPPDGL